MDVLLIALKGELTLQDIPKDNRLWQVFVDLNEAYNRTLFNVFPITTGGEILNDVNKAIIAYLNDRDFISIRMTCRALRDLPYDNLFWKTKFEYKYSVNISPYIKEPKNYELKYKELVAINERTPEFIFMCIKLGYLPLIESRLNPKYMVPEKLLKDKREDAVENITKIVMIRLYRLSIILSIQYHKIDILKYLLSVYPVDSIPLLHSFEEDSEFGMIETIAGCCTAEEFQCIEASKTCNPFGDNELKILYSETINFRNANLLEYILQKYESSRSYFSPLNDPHILYHLIEHDILKDFEDVDHMKNDELDCQCPECLNDAISDKVRDIVNERDNNTIKVLTKYIPRDVMISSVFKINIDILSTMLHDYYTLDDIPHVLSVMVQRKDWYVISKILEVLKYKYKGSDYRKIFHQSFILDMVNHHEGMCGDLLPTLPKDLPVPTDVQILKTLQVSKLKLLLKYKKLKVSGKKDELIDRLASS